MAICCFTFPLSLTVNLPRTGFCIGEGIPLTTALNNGSGRAITLRAAVVEIVTYHAYAQGRTQTTSYTLYNFHSPPFPGHTTSQWAPAPAEQQAIPSVYPTIANGGIIRLEYTLRIEAVIPWDINTIINIPITLGNTSGVLD